MKILFIVNVDWFFISHRLPIALAAIEEGYEVHIACGVTNRKKDLESLGIFVHPLSITRSGTSVLKELRVIKQMNFIVKNLKPDVVHLVTIKGAVYGGLVTRFKNIKNRVVSITGLGFVFIDGNIKARAIRFVITKLYRLALNSANTTVIFQNENDKNIFVKNRIIKSEQSVIIRGSGIEIRDYDYFREPTGGKVVMFLARLLKDKGLIEFCEAAVILKESGVLAKFVLVGDIDLENPNSITQSELEHYIKLGVIEHWGFTTDVSETIAKSHIMVLPSYREGLPKSLIEAAACGRAVITTNVPGCRDAIEPDVTGLLVEVKNSKELAQVIQRLLENDLLRNEMGKAGRKLAEEHFNINDVVDTHMSIYRGEH
ncbi:glycosyltransferase family 4 protein [Pseudoalteromonas distincta]|uniref:glycosyltransferase family 4 protein n=1 Tax=Pseudoalteromonas distincta TaxID=77608 RepID=UPI0039EBD729